MEDHIVNDKLTIENGKPTMEDHIVNDKLTIENGKPTMEDHIVNDKLTIENGNANDGRSHSEWQANNKAQWRMTW